jgi:ERCC4-type nuclease
MEILVDTREQCTAKAEQRYKSFGVPYSRNTLAYGDYTANFTLLDGSKLYDTSNTISPICVVERKMNLDELAQCFTSGRERFEREFEKAVTNNCFIHLICEEGSWEKIEGHKYRSKFPPKAYIASLTAWQRRYNIHVHFCSSLESGKLIKEFLYRDMKERIERGEFDGT